MDLWVETMDQQVTWVQRQYMKVLREWQTKYDILLPTQDDYLNSWSKDGKLVIPPDLGLKRKLMHHVHNGYTAGHPGRDEMLRKARCFFWWPDMKSWIEDYVKGCVTCQQEKILIYHTKVPMYKIPMQAKALPFQMVAMDLIIGLLPNEDLDSILTIMDHGCSRAALFLPCMATVTSPKIVQLYLNHVYRWFGLPHKMILD